MMTRVRDGLRLAWLVAWVASWLVAAWLLSPRHWKTTNRLLAIDLGAWKDRRR